VSWEVFKHPAYSMVLLPYNFHIFGMLKTALESYVFISDDSVQEAVVQWLRQQVGYAKLCLIGTPSQYPC
jgi:hypothetical protein